MPNDTIKKENGKLSPTTIEDYENLLNKHIDPYIGVILWGEISSKEIKNWKQRMGHSDIKTTEGYIHADNSLQNGIADMAVFKHKG